MGSSGKKLDRLEVAGYFPKARISHRFTSPHQPENTICRAHYWPVEVVVQGHDWNEEALKSDMLKNTNDLLEQVSGSLTQKGAALTKYKTTARTNTKTQKSKKANNV